MKLVVGLGNPGPRYETTRHNIGFLIIDALAARLGLPLRDRGSSRSHHAQVATNGDIALIKPMTYMNCSGAPLSAILDELHLAPEADELLIIHDDLDQGMGQLRLRQGGGAGGHRGILSIQEHLPNVPLYRLKVGIGKPDSGSVEIVDWVLSPFTSAELRQLGGLIPYATAFTLSFLADGPSRTMNRYNQKAPLIFLLNPSDDRVS